LGLYVGIEFVTNRQTLEPAPAHASHITNRAKDYGVLLSTDSPLYNVIKLKPPIIFTNENADNVVHIVDRILTEDYLRI
jgi:4-aminobutyrate aminotransferase-like enzyme